MLSLLLTQSEDGDNRRICIYWNVPELVLRKEFGYYRDLPILPQTDPPPNMTKGDGYQRFEKKRQPTEV